MMNSYIYQRYVYATLFDFFTENKCPDFLFKKFIVYMFSKKLEFLRLNKLTVAIGHLLQKCYSEVNDLTLRRIHRYSTYIEEARNIHENLADSGIDVVIIKTLSVFPKDISDIDLLIASKEDLEKASRVMMRIGYRPAKSGMEQHLWRRLVDGVVVDVEIHSSIAAAGYEYYPKRLVFERAIFINKVKVPSYIDSILIMASHLVMKDLYITLSDLLEFGITLKKYIGDEEVLLNEAKKLGLEIPLLSMMYYDSVINPRDSHELSSWQKILSSTVLREHYARPSLITVVSSYFRHASKRAKRELLGKVLKEVMSIPRGKGLDALVHYILGLKPTVKRFEE